MNSSLAYKIVQSHYDDLSHNRIPVIAKSLKCTPEEVSHAEEQISQLEIHPGALFATSVVHNITPDVTLTYDEDKPIV